MSGVRIYLTLVAVFFIASAAQITNAATITVDAQIGQSGCDLLEAIQSANEDQPIGGCLTGDESDEIIISGLHIIEMPFDSVGAPPSFGDAGLPTVTTPITISSISGTSEIRREVSDPLNRFRIFNVVGGSASLTLNNIVVSGGDVNFDLSGNDATTRGGAIYVTTGEITLNSSTIKNNRAVSFGGGIYSLAANKITIQDSLITGNSANSSSAFSLNSDSEVLFLNSSIENNMTTVGAGEAFSALLVESILFYSSSIINNASGGIRLTGGNLTMLDSTVSGNIKDVSQLDLISENIGGIELSPIVDSESRHRIVNSTITNNPPNGIQAPTSIDIRGISIFPPINTSTEIFSVSIRNTIVSGNGSSGSSGPPEGYEIDVYDDGGAYTADNVVFEFTNNVIGHAGISEMLALNNITINSTDNQILTSDSSNPTELNEIINPLGGYGGPTPTHTLPANSPAINSGFEGYPVLIPGEGLYWEPGCRGEEFALGSDPPFRNDQRGLNRPIDTDCDVGSTEFRTADIIGDCYVVKTANDSNATFCL